MSLSGNLYPILFVFFFNYIVMKVYVFNTQSKARGLLKLFVQCFRKSAED